MTTIQFDTTMRLTHMRERAMKDLATFSDEVRVGMVSGTTIEGITRNSATVAAISQVLNTNLSGDELEAYANQMLTDLSIHCAGTRSGLSNGARICNDSEIDAWSRILRVITSRNPVNP